MSDQTPKPLPLPLFTFIVGYGYDQEVKIAEALVKSDERVIVLAHMEPLLYPIALLIYGDMLHDQDYYNTAWLDTMIEGPYSGRTPREIMQDFEEVLGEHAVARDCYESWRGSFTDSPRSMSRFVFIDSDDTRIAPFLEAHPTECLVVDAPSNMLDRGQYPLHYTADSNFAEPAVVVEGLRKYLESGR